MKKEEILSTIKIKGGELLEALRARGEDGRDIGGDHMRRFAARLDRDDGGLGSGAHDLGIIRREA